MDSKRFLEQLRSCFVLRGGAFVSDEKFKRMSLKELLHYCECNHIDINATLPEIRR